jgi:hypothetical protein
LTLTTTIYEGSLFGQAEPLIKPAGYTADHLLYRPLKSGEANCSFISTITVWTCAINHKQCIQRIVFDGIFINAGIRQTDRTFYMTICKRFLATDVEQNKIHSTVGNRVMHIPTIGFEFK